MSVKSDGQHTGTTQIPQSAGLAHLLGSGNLLNVGGGDEFSAIVADIAARVCGERSSDLVNLTTLDGKGSLVVRASYGNRTNLLRDFRFSVDAGVGGQAFSKGKTVMVKDYRGIGAADELKKVLVKGEGVRSAAAVPLVVESRPIGLIFIGRRDSKRIDELQLKRLEAICCEAASFIMVLQHVQNKVELAVTDARLRLANYLHQELIPLLFYIGATATRMRTNASAESPETLDYARRIEEMSSVASAVAREALGPLTTLSGDQNLEARISGLVDRFSKVSGVSTDMSVSGHPSSSVVQRSMEVLESVVVEALNNVAKHTASASALVTLTYGLDEIEVTVRDNGTGLPDGFQRTFTLGSSQFGLASLEHQLRLLNGVLDLEPNADGGVTLRAAIPNRPQ